MSQPVNFLFKLAKSEKDKQRLAQAELVKELGQNFYNLSLAERENARIQKYLELFAPKLLVPNGAEHKLALPVQEIVKEEKLEQQIPKEAFAPLPVTSIKEIETTNAEVKKIEAETKAKKPHESFALSIELNERQQMLSDYVLNDKCCVITGPAGTGKTTAVREVAKNLFYSGKLGFHTFKIRGTGERVSAPSVAFVAYTNRASSNLAKAILKDDSLSALSPCITTIHNLLEYEPEFFTIETEDGETKETMRFVPRRTAANPLDCTHIFIEESSQVGALDLFPRLFEACRPGTKLIFIGDINQLQPIFSPSILNYALTTLPVIELTEVYRQALDSPIIANAHRCLRGEKLEQSLPHFRIIRGDKIKKIPSESGCADLMINSFRKWIDQKDEHNEPMYDPEQDIVLSPFNKNACGTIELNYKIAQFLGKKRNAMVYEIIAGIRKLYLAEGDRVMYMKQEGIITKINHNGLYVGRMPQAASTDLTRFGTKEINLKGDTTVEDFELSGYENLSIDTKGSNEDNEEKIKQQASHTVHIQLESGQKVILSKAGEFSENNFSLGYALTVHKAQGAEWRKVFIMIHRNQAVLLNRELIYTAITRAREYCTIVDLSNVLEKAIAAQRIKGNSTEEKIAYFNSEVSLKEPVSLIP